MNKHPKRVDGYNGSLEELAKAVEEMRYDKVAEFLRAYASATQARADSDRDAGRKKLASMLYHHVATMNQAVREMEDIWILCEPCMRENEQQ